MFCASHSRQPARLGLNSREPSAKGVHLDFEAKQLAPCRKAVPGNGVQSLWSGDSETHQFRFNGAAFVEMCINGYEVFATGLQFRRLHL